MIVDTSALLAILRDEPEAPVCAQAIVIDASGDPIASRRLDDLDDIARIGIEATVEQAHIGREAYRDFGKGSGHPAQLNFGDCFSYALARAMAEPLLFSGRDFSHTDLTSATG